MRGCVSTLLLLLLLFVGGVVTYLLFVQLFLLFAFVVVCVRVKLFVL